MHLLKYRPSKLALTALRNRQEIIKAQLSRRDLFKMGLLTSGGYLVAKRGLSSRASADTVQSPPTSAFIEPMPRLKIKQDISPSDSAFGPMPTVTPNTGAGEARTRDHQALNTFSPARYYKLVQQEAKVSLSPDLPQQTLWGFDGIVPGPLYVGRYGEPVLIRNVNNLPPVEMNGGFGLPSVSTHLHNGHTPSESDGFACDFFERTFFYDQHYPNVLPGWNSTHKDTFGDIKESLSTLWYHDHRVDFTSQNVYKGLAGMYLLFNNQFDTGDETSGFRLPSGLGDDGYDVPIMLNDKVFDPQTGLLFFDLFNLDGILGDKFLANGKIQPYFDVKPRKYRFRVLNGGPSRFYDLFLTDLTNLSAHNLFWQISNDGNLLPKPVQVESFNLGVAERVDVIIDFRPFAGRTIYLENRMEQTNGRGPTGKTLTAGAGNLIIQFRVGSDAVTEDCADPATITCYDLPDTSTTPRVTRTFRFERQNGQWAINGKFMDCDEVRFRVKRNTAEKWVLQNNSGGWQHPIHIHFEEFQILKRNRVAPPLTEKSRKDVVRLQFNEQIELYFRFRDFVGRFPLHCHNTVHEDHAMILRWEIDDVGDTKTKP